MNYTSIKNWAEEDRPREKLLEKGCSSLTETELLAILIGSGTKNTSALDIAKIIFSKANNNLNELYKCTITDLMQFKGIGEARAITLSAAFELGRRRNIAEVRQKKQISSSKEIFNLMHPKIGDLKHEEFWAIYLNQKNALFGTVLNRVESKRARYYRGYYSKGYYSKAYYYATSATASVKKGENSSKA